jgi:2-hydroxy-3-oxopropionate reductase
MLCKESGTDLTKVLDAIRGGSAGSAVLETKSPKILKKDYKPGFKIDLHIKDLKNAKITGEKLELHMPITDVASSMYETLSKEGFGDLDHSALFTYYEQKHHEKNS